MRSSSTSELPGYIRLPNISQRMEDISWAKVLWDQMSGGHRGFSLDKFLYCYKPQQIFASQEFYNFMRYKASLELVYDMPDSNHNWKNKYFFVQGSNWVCIPNKWEIIGEGYDNT